MRFPSLASLSGLRTQSCRDLWGRLRYRCSSDTALWLWHRPMATALIHPLAWELPYATGATLKKKRKKEKISHVEVLTLYTPKYDHNWNEGLYRGGSVKMRPLMWALIQYD